MNRRKKSLLVCGGILVLLIFVCTFWMQTNPLPQLQLPKGASLEVIMDRSDNHVPKGWYTNRFTPLSVAIKLSGNMVLYRLKLLLGRSYIPVPNPPRDVDMRRNLADCSEQSGETYLLARELFPDGYSDNWPEIDFNLGYVYGGTNQIRHVRDWVALNEAGIVDNGVVSLRKIDPVPTVIVVGTKFMEPYLTNQCAIIRDTKGIVKVVPLSCLNAYRNAGLIKLPIVK